MDSNKLTAKLNYLNTKTAVVVSSAQNFMDTNHKSYSWIEQC